MKKRNREVIHFKTQINSPHAMVVRRNIDFPFKSFFIRNVGDAIYLDIETQRIELKFKIAIFNGSSNLVLLNNIDNLLTSFVNVPMAPVELLLKLQSIGINLLPLEEDASKCGCSSKTDLVNSFAYNAVSVLSVVCSFRSTNFCQSKTCKSNNIILKMRDNDDKVIY